jgi:chromosomal replication initiation ATPase DnaA
LSDERILGRGEFVERVIEEADERLKYQLPVNERREKISELIQQLCESEKINSHELASGSRRRLVSKARSRIAQKLVKTHGVPLAEVARRVGVSTSAVSKIISKTEK